MLYEVITGRIGDHRREGDGGLFKCPGAGGGDAADAHIRSMGEMLPSGGCHRTGLLQTGGSVNHSSYNFV